MFNNYDRDDFSSPVRNDFSSSIRKYNRSVSKSPLENTHQYRNQNGRSSKKRIRHLPNPIQEEPELEMLEFPLPKTLWQSDSVPACAVCENKFKRFLGKSRHHCRICGKCVCGVCSIYRLRDHRICKKCKTAPGLETRFPELADERSKSYTLDVLSTPLSVFDDAVQLSEPEDVAHSPPCGLPSGFSLPAGINLTSGGSFQQGVKDGPNGYATNYPREGSSHFDFKPTTGATPYGAFSEGLPSPRLLSKRNQAFSDCPALQRDTSEHSISSFGRDRSDGNVQCNADLSQWKSRHCIRWIRSLRLGDNEEKAVDAIRDLGLCGSDLHDISDRDLQVEMKIFSAILRRRILRNLQQLSQETADAMVQEDGTGDIAPLNDKDIMKLARNVQILQAGTFDAIDRIFILNSPSQYEVKWHSTNIRPGIHKLTVVDRQNLGNSSTWIMRYHNPSHGHTIEPPSLETHCLSTNKNGLRWRLHNKSVELCINSVSDDLNTDLIISLSTINVPQVLSSSVKASSVKSSSRRLAISKMS